MAAITGSIWFVALVLQLIMPAIKVEAASNTIPIVRSNTNIQCFAQITADRHYAEVGTPISSFQNVVNPPSGTTGAAYQSTLQAVQAGTSMPYIFFSADTESKNACYFAAMLFQAPGQGHENEFYGYLYDDANGNTRAPVLVAALGTVDPATKTLFFTTQAVPGSISAASYSVNVRDPSSPPLFNSTFFPSLQGGGGGGTNTGPCSVFTTPATVSACQNNPDPRFVDIATISYRGETYTTSHWGGGSMKWFLSSTFDPARKTYNIDKGDACRPFMAINTDNGNFDINIDDDSLGSLQDIEKALAKAEAQGSVDASFTDFNAACAKIVDNKGGYKVKDPVNARIWGAYYDATKTVNLFFTDADHNESQYLSAYKTTDFKTFAGTNIPGCESSAPHFDFGQALNTVGAGTATVSGKWFLNAGSPCEDYEQIGVRVKIAPKDQQPPALKSDAASEPDASVHVDCEWSFNPLTWIMCPLLDATQGIINTVGSFIKDQLQIDANTYFDKNSDTGQKIYQAWNSVRIIALTLLVVIALVMVIAQALSLEVFDAYTVKKVLPKLAIAIIGITLSWEITRLLVVFSNDLAKAVQSIILAPFGDLGNPTLNTAQVGVVAGGLAVVGIAFLLTIFAAAALALLLAFVAIVLRQMIVIFLVIVAPIAILASILPNTQKAWKIWHETFNGALLVYSIIIGFIALGAAFGKVVDETKTPAAPFIALIATYAPYFLIPKAFSMASGLIGTIGGMVNDRSRGLFDGLRKRRSDIMKGRYQRATADKLWTPENKAIKAMSGSKYRAVRALNPNKLASWAAAPHKNLAYSSRNRKIPGTKWGIPVLSNMGRQLESSIEHEAFKQTQEQAQELNTAISSNDKAARALAGLHHGFSAKTQKALRAAGLTWKDKDGVEHGKVLTSTKDVDTAANIMSQSDSHTEKVAATALRRAAPVIGRRFKDPERNYASVAASAGLILGAHGFYEQADTKTLARNIQNETGSAEFADAELVQTELAVASSMPHMRAGYGHLYDSANDEWLDLKDADRELDVIEATSPGQLAGAKGGAIKDQRKTFEFILDNADVSSDVKQERVQAAQSKISAARQEIKRLRPFLSEAQVDAQMQQDPEAVRAQAELQQVMEPSHGEKAQQQLDQRVAQLAAQHPEMSEKEVKDLVKYDPTLKDTNKVAQAWRMGDSFKQQMLFSLASRYSQTAVDNKKQIMEIINSRPDIKAEFDRFEGRAAQGDAEVMAMINANNAGAQAQQQAQILAQQRLQAQQNISNPPLPPQRPI